MLQVSSVVPASFDERAFFLVAMDRRSTDANPCAAHERHRSILVARSALQVPPDRAHSQFYALLQSTILKLAEGMFAAWAKVNLAATEYPSAKMTLDSVLAYWAEEKQRESIDGAKILAWLAASATLAALAPAKQAVWKSKIPKIAAPSYRQNFSKDQALAILAQLADSDAAHACAIFIAQRCQNIIDAPDSQEEAL